MSDFDAPPFIASREQVVVEARSWLETRFHHQARKKGVGVDCAGLLIGVCWALGIKPRSFDVKGYPAIPDGLTLKRYCDEHMVRIPQSIMQPGDAVLIRWRNGPPQHLGIVGDYRHGGLSIIHAIGPMLPNKVIETRLVFGQHMQFVGAYSIPGVG